MLDINFVRENLEAVRTALANRNYPPDSLDKFAELDAERRRVITEADALNQARNASSKEIGALMQAGKRDEAEAKKSEVAGLKDKQLRGFFPKRIDERADRLAVEVGQLGEGGGVKRHAAALGYELGELLAQAALQDRDVLRFHEGTLCSLRCV